MTLEILTPALGKTKKSVKDLILSTLIFEHPLTLAKLTNSIKKKFGASVTFQGVRRAVNALLEQKVVVKKEKEYEINKDWIIQTKDFIDRLYDSYLSSGTHFTNVEELGDDIKIYTLPNLIESDKFWNIIVRKWLEDDKNAGKPKSYYQLSGHAWYVFGQMGEESAIFDEMKQKGVDFYILCEGDTPLDRWCKKVYESIGGHFTTNRNKKNHFHNKYFSVYNDFVIQTEHPEHIAKEMEEIYQTAKDFENFDAIKLSRLLLMKCDIKVIVMRNPLIAEQLRNNVMTKFKEKQIK
ncbi:hypothetical protein HY636_05425 [Candidatus Woesearchaeota archaeon]|nr:hypothetical protein [Candidatus Woesearchaeota archaeon]